MDFSLIMNSKIKVIFFFVGKHGLFSQIYPEKKFVEVVDVQAWGGSAKKKGGGTKNFKYLRTPDHFVSAKTHINCQCR